MKHAALISAIAAMLAWLICIIPLSLRDKTPVVTYFLALAAAILVGLIVSYSLGGWT